MSDPKVMQEKKKDCIFVMRQIWLGFRIPAVLFGRDKAILYQTCRIGSAWLAKLKEFVAREDDISSSLPVVLKEMSENISAVRIRVPGVGDLVAGPIGSTSMTALQQARWLSEYGEKGTELAEKLPVLGMRTMASLSFLIGFSLTGIRFYEESLYEVSRSRSDSPGVEDEKLFCSYQMRQIREDLCHVSYAREQAFVQSIREGKPENEGDKPALEEELGDYGILSLAGDKKQFEYLLVSGITIMTRTAIQSGVLPQKAYEVSDLLLQQLSLCDSMPQMSEVFVKGERVFGRLVQEGREHHTDPVVEKAKDYIGRFLRSPFTISQMAHDLKVSRGYLSQRFREKTGMTLNTYIRLQRLERAANLLCYSTEPVGSIAAYLQFGSQSRFGSWFRKVYGMTPLEYRRTHQPEGFREEDDLK
ncbi:MAG: helix-turn-helix domain-containing protein [Lachnospiraceae bacterium]